jgi:hypothetical protein
MIHHMSARLVRILFATAIAVVHPFALGAISDLRTLAAQLTENGDVHFTGDLICETGSGRGDAKNVYSDSDGDALIRIAESKTIYVFAHGFYNRNPRRTKPPLSYAKDTWEGYLDLARNRGEPYAACLLLSDSASGFGPHQPALGDFLFAVRLLTDSEALFDPDRRIVLVGYSAGANYIKQGIVTFAAHLRANDIAPRGLRPTRMTLGFLGGVHNGADATALVAAAVGVADAFGRGQEVESRTSQESFDKRWREFERSERAALTSSRGAQQLLAGSPELAHLNQEFQSALTPNVRIVNAASSADFVAPLRTTALDFAPSMVVGDLNHWGFVNVPLAPSAARIANAIYSAW